MTSSTRPDIVVGVDIGQTCSGVAFSIGPDWSDPKTIQRWPGLYGIERKDKVATRVGYVNGELKRWGESCDWSETSVDVREQFKLTLDQSWNDYRGYTSAEAKTWYCDFLRCLHREIAKHFDDHIPRWREMRVEYNFSTPTTWRSPGMIAGIEKAIKQSGFTSSKLETVRMSLTEAEAAAIEASTTRYRNGDVFVICDAGGGTTDVNILKVQSVQNKIELEPLDHVEGVPIGSTLIDNLMAQHILDRLSAIEQHLTSDIMQVAEEMLKGRFETVKHSFPEPIHDHFDLEIRGLPGRQTFEEVGIFDSAMRIDRETLRIIFDEQITKIFRLLDDRLSKLQEDHPTERVSYIVLSGGFGSSPYLLEQVRRRYESNFGFTSPNTTNVHIMRIPEPQLVVTRGLVRERTQQLGNDSQEGQEAFRYRRCRNSYGVVVSVDYKEELHEGLPITHNPLTGKKTVENLVDWIIKRGDVIDIEKGVYRSYGADLHESDRTAQRHVRIVMAKDPDKQPPRLFDPATCEDLVRVNYTLTENDMMLVKSRFKLGSGYWKAAFQFVVMLGSADLRFQIRGRNGLLSSDHDSLEVEFMDSSAFANNGPVSAQSNGLSQQRVAPSQPNDRQNGYANGQANGDHVGSHTAQRFTMKRLTSQPRLSFVKLKGGKSKATT